MFVSFPCTLLHVAVTWLKTEAMIYSRLLIFYGNLLKQGFIRDQRNYILAILEGKAYGLNSYVM